MPPRSVGSGPRASAARRRRSVAVARPTPYRSNPVDTAHGDRESLLLWPDGAPGALGAVPRTGPRSRSTARPRRPRTAPPSSCARAAATARWPAPTRAKTSRSGSTRSACPRSSCSTGWVRATTIPCRCRTRSARSACCGARQGVRLRSGTPRDPGVLRGRASGRDHGHAFRRRRPDAKDPIDRMGSRPDFMVLAYPVMSMTAPFSHKGSIENLLGRRRTRARRGPLERETRDRADAARVPVPAPRTTRGCPSRTAWSSRKRCTRRACPSSCTCSRRANMASGSPPAIPCSRSGRACARPGCARWGCWTATERRPARGGTSPARGH